MFYQLSMNGLKILASHSASGGESRIYLEKILTEK